MKIIRKYYRFIRSIPISIFFNFWYLPFNQAIKFPIIISYRMNLLNISGKVLIECQIKTAMIKIGFNEVAIFNWKYSRPIWENSGTIIFKGKAHIGHGSKISNHGTLILGDDFLISAESAIVCWNEITFGYRCRISWDVLIIDTDIHPIHDLNNNVVGKPSGVITIGRNVWIGNRSLILKNVIIDDYNIIGAGSVVRKSIKNSYQIFAGNPAVFLKDGVYRKED